MKALPSRTNKRKPPAAVARAMVGARLLLGAKPALRVLILAIFLLVSGSPEALAEKRVALVVGNSEYENTVYLENPRNDAKGLAEALRRLGFEVIERTDLRHTDMQATLLEYSNKLRGADVGLFFYAGHGLQVDGRNYLVPVDAELNSEVDLAFETTELDVVMRILQRQTRTGLVFLDACRNNPLAGNLTRSMGSTRSAAVGNGLARVDSGVGMLITFATQPGNVALDGFGNHSPFTEALLEYIETPGIDVAQMLRRVRDKVLNSTNGKQVPWNNSSLTEDFYFRPEVKEEPQVAALPPAPEQSGTADSGSVARAPANQSNVAIELAFWQSIVNSNDPAVFEAYLAQFPEGSFSSLARLRLKTLRGQAAATPQATQQTTPQQLPAQQPVTESKPKVLEPQKAQPPKPNQVAALPPAKDSEPSFKVDRLDELQFALKVSNVRAGPGTSHGTVGRLKIGEEVKVTGKVAGQNWYRIALAGGREGFVFGSLLSPNSPQPPAAPKAVETPKQQAAVVEKPAATPQTSTGPSAEEQALLAEQAYWDSVRNSRNPLDYERYLLRYGETGLFSREARRRSASLRAQKDAQLAAAETASKTSSQTTAQTTKASAPAANSGTSATNTAAAKTTETAASDSATAPQTAELTPPTETLPVAKYDGAWEGKASVRFGTQCKSSYNIELNIGDARVTGTMARSSERYNVTGTVDKSGSIQDLSGFFRVKVLFKISSATKDGIEGTWDMGSKSDYGGSPCRGNFSVTRVGS